MTILQQFDPEQFDQELSPVVPSPCQQVCRMDNQGRLCLGCWRTIDEIAGWSRANNSEKLRIWREVKRRFQADQVSS